MDATLRDNTNSQATIDYLKKRLILKGIKTEREDYANISGAEETVAIGRLMGKVDATGKIVPHEATAVDGSQIPIGVLLEPLDAIAIAGTVDGVLIGRGGDLNTDLVIFGNSDAETLATTCTSTGGDVKTIKDWLLSDTGLEPVTVDDASEYAN